MSKNLVIGGVNYDNVPSIIVPTQDAKSAEFIDKDDAGAGTGDPWQAVKIADHASNPLWTPSPTKYVFRHKRHLAYVTPTLTMKSSKLTVLDDDQPLTFSPSYFPVLEKIKIDNASFTMYPRSDDDSPNLTTIVSVGNVLMYGYGSFTNGAFPSLTNIVCTDTTFTRPLTNVQALSQLTHYGAVDNTGKIWVPDNLVDKYKAATNWSTFADNIHPLSEYTGWLGEPIPKDDFYIYVEFDDGTVETC